MTAFTRTTITNLALRELTASRIEDFDDDQAEAIIARDVWDQAVGKTLERHEWQFAMKGVELARSAVVPAVRYAYAYTLPGDFVRLGAVAANSNMAPVLDQEDGFVVRDDGLWSNAERVFIEYVYNAPAIGTWPHRFVDVLVADLASVMASPLKSTAERERLEQLADKRLRIGRAIDSAQQQVGRRPAGSWRSAARGSWRG